MILAVYSKTNNDESRLYQCVYLVQILIQPYGSIPCERSINQSDPCIVDISLSSFMFVYIQHNLCICM